MIKSIRIDGITTGYRWKTKNKNVDNYSSTGKWQNRSEYNDHLWAECSECGFRQENYKVVEIGKSSNDYIKVIWNYCPICGAKMSV